MGLKLNAGLISNKSYPKNLKDLLIESSWVPQEDSTVKIKMKVAKSASKYVCDECFNDTSSVGEN